MRLGEWEGLGEGLGLLAHLSGILKEEYFI